MALPFSLAGKLEKNKIANDKPWIMLLKIILPDGEPVTIARNNEDITWNGITWYAFPFDASDKSEDMKSIPTFDIKVSNVDRLMQSYLEEYDGMVDCETTIYLVHAAHLDVTAAEIEETFTVQETNYDDSWCYFKLGADFWFFYRALADRYLKDYCSHKYGKIKCGVKPSVLITYPTCSHVLSDCRVRMAASGLSSLRFYGEPALPGGQYVSNS